MPRLALEKALKKNKMSKRQFAKRMGIDYKNIFRLFNEERDPRFSQLVRYAKAIHCKVRDLIEE